MKNLNAIPIFLSLALLISGALSAQSNGQTNTKPEIVQTDVDKPDPIWQPPTGLLSDDEKKLEVSVYPNPSNGEFIVRFIKLNRNSEILIYNLIGNLVAQEQISMGPNGTGEKRIDLSHLPKGYYILKLEDQSMKLCIR